MFFRIRTRSAALVATLATLATLASGCGIDSSTGSATNRPTVVVSTNILGDVVENLVDDEIDVVTIMPAGADPHDFQASAQQIAEIGNADVLIINGAGFEEGLVDVLESAAADGVKTLEVIKGDEDPHFFTDPARMAVAAAAITDFLIDNVDGIDVDALQASSAAYVDQLEALDTEIEEVLAVIPAERRILVTNHDVFAYFAERYGFEIVGTVIPSGATTDGASAQDLAELTDRILTAGVPAIFADTSSSDELAQTLAGEVGEIAVVDLYSESLGGEGSDGASYVDMVRTNAQRIADALGE